MLKEQLRACMDGKTMSEEEAERAMNYIMAGKATASQIASMLTVLRFRGETVDEITGFARAMRAHSLRIQVDDLPVVDTCGTGGDNLKTFNISTATALVLSSVGVPIAKHGNRAVSSKSGSADALERLHIPIQYSPEEASRSLQQVNLCFMFAPIYHESMKHAVVPRREIGFRTIFNMLGPLTNPARAKHQLIGVYDFEFAKKMAEALSRLGTKKALVVSGENGLDEFSISTKTNVIEVTEDGKKIYSVAPEDVGLTRGTIEHIQVENAEESAALIKKIIKNEANEAAKGIVCLNGGAALYAANRVSSIKEGVAEIKHALESGIAYRHFQSLQIEKKGKEQHA